MEIQNNLPNAQDPLIKKNLKSNLISWIAASAGLLVVVLLIGGGAMLAGRVWDPLWNPLRPNPNKVISAAFSNLQKTSTMHLVSDIDINLGSQVLSTSFAGDIDSHDVNSLKAQGKLDVTYSDALLQSSYAKSDVKLIGNDMYIDILDYSPLVNAYASLLHVNIDNLKGQWMLVSGNQLASVSDIYRIKNTILNKGAFTFKKRLPDEMLDGQKIYHYLVTLNSAAISGMLGQNPSAQMVGALGPIDVDLGIGSKDGNIESVAFSKKQVENFMQGNKVDISVKIRSSSFNQPFSVQAPAKFVRLENIQLKK